MDWINGIPSDGVTDCLVDWRNELINCQSLFFTPNQRALDFFGAIESQNECATSKNLTSKKINAGTRPIALHCTALHCSALHWNFCCLEDVNEFWKKDQGRQPVLLGSIEMRILFFVVGCREAFYTSQNTLKIIVAPKREQSVTLGFSCKTLYWMDACVLLQLR